MPSPYERLEKITLVHIIFYVALVSGIVTFAQVPFFNNATRASQATITQDSFDKKADNTAFSLLSPLGGDRWSFGSDQTIRWTGGDASWPVTINLVDDSNSRLLRTLAVDVLNNGIQPWNVDVPPGSYRIYISACPKCSRNGWAISTFPFTVTEGSNLNVVSHDNTANKSLVFYSPRGGEVYAVGSTQSVSWHGGDPGDTYTLSLIKASPFRISEVLADDLPNNGLFSWNLSLGLPNGLYYLYLSCKHCSNPNTAYTFYPFTIYNQNPIY